MKDRQLYYSRKAGRIIIEGKRKGKTIYVFGLPNPLKLIESLKIDKGKYNNMMDKIQSLDIREKGNNKTTIKGSCNM